MLFPRPERLLGVVFVLLLAMPVQAAPARLRVLFLGDDGHHAPAERHRQLAGALKSRGIDLVYTTRVEDLEPATLAKYDALLVYANHVKITPAQEKALLDYVASGKGFVPLHCASYCFLNSPAYIALVGAQFRSHGTGTFRARVSDASHPVTKGYSGFTSWDETYLHHKHNEKDRIVLEHRVDGEVEEPWTWVRTHGKGRVFYTAWGHDARTFGHPGFQNLVERGIRWACQGDPSVVPAYQDQPEMTKLAKDLPPFRYVDAKVPNYVGGGRGGLGKPISKMQLPLPASESMRHLVTPVEFEVKLFADEKLLGGKPICMAWDEKGRLWAALTRDYPNELQPAGKGRDRIVLVEDTDGDGLADRVTTFADRLSIPTSIAFTNGGLVVHQAPDTLFLKDTDGDGKADVRKTLFTGWITNDTHAGPSNLHYGPDNWLYGMVGYAGFKGTVGGEEHSFRQGFYRFRPDGSRMEFLRNTNNNSWGVGFSEEGLLFGSTANGNPSVYLPIPNRYYEPVHGWSSTVLGGIAGNAPMHPITKKVRQVDWHGHFTAAAGHALYTARTYPRAYWNRTAFVTEPTGHLVATFTLQRDGADFRSRNAWNLLASDDEWCSPIMAEVGPDGNVWVIDWYNYIVQHNPTPAGFVTGKGNAYETELRDRKHGRIYRLVHRKAKAAKLPSLGDATPADLVRTLGHDNLFWRRHAQRLLVERKGLEVVPALVALVQDDRVDEIGLAPGAIHALWTLHGLGALDAPDPRAREAAFRALKHPSAGVRRNAALVLPATPDATRRLLDAGLLEDADAQVQLAALLSLAEKPGPDTAAGQRLAALLAREELLGDRWLPDALTSAASKHALPFLEQAARHPKSLAPRAHEILRIVARHWASGGSRPEVDGMLKAVTLASTPVAETLLAGLATGWKPGTTVPLVADTERQVVERLPGLSAPGKASLLRFMVAIGSKGVQKHAAAVVKALVATIEKADASDDDRIAAAKQVIELQPDDDTAVKQILEVIAPRSSPALVGGLLEAVATSRAKGSGKALVEKFDGLTPAARTQAIRVLLGRPTATTSLLDAIDRGSVKLADLALDQKQALAAHPNREIRDRAKKILARGGDLPNPDRQKVIDALKPLLARTGDTTRGKAVFKNQCAKCHTHSGEGTAIGPDLTGMAAHPKEELLIHVMDPSRSVEGNFRVYTVTTQDGKVYTGMLAAETRTTIEIVDGEAKRTTIRRDDVEQINGSAKSLMPEGFEKQLKETEIVDLLEFLTQKGKYLPLPLDKVASAVSTRGMFYGPEAGAERLIFPDWKPKEFAGVPFYLVDPRGGKVNNVVLLYGPQGKIPPTMPRSVSLPCHTGAKAIHLLSGVSGWGFPLGKKGSVTMIVRLHYKDGKSEDHELRNGEHFADYIRRVDVEGSKFAFALRGQQIRYLSITPRRAEPLTKIDLVKGPDGTAPVVMAVTVETR